MTHEVSLRHGVPGELNGVRYIVRRVRTPKERPVSVALVVLADGEENYDLGIGDTFPVRNETWALDRVENLPRPDWRVVLRKVE
ncbi:DUF6406 domain-containing protein [Streptomyces sp. ITFR-16]|uniref:DUF6406 domain-containing protein n=1 Tax=Streptomyces sp. ITFR-16 TaxID=3075198 RepID=UPI002889797B|nr:DUF6406 domain-containing protein [Streptomyces sp. ITFR-16]WNI20966.1 DUF6406 domain-containing protein [Streptomyces sp. ITFR-16]